MEFDADENVLVCIAHDGGLLGVLDFYPHGDINGWKEKGWKEQTRWGFVNELPVDGRPGREVLVGGLVRDGEVVGVGGGKDSERV